jgi:hypothetical protein
MNTRHLYEEQYETIPQGVYFLGISTSIQGGLNLIYRFNIICMKPPLSGGHVCQV